MYSHTDVIDEPISLSDEIWSYFTITESDELYIDPDRSPLQDLERKDGVEFDEDDERALLPYGGFLHIVNFLKDVENEGDQDDDSENVTDSGFPVETLPPFPNLTRVDGAPLTEEDEAALLEFGAFAMLLSNLANHSLAGGLIFPLVGAEDEPPTGSRVAPPNSSAASKPLFPFNMARRDGAALDSADEAALLEFAPFVYLGKVFEYVFGDAPVVGDLGAFPEADEDLAQVGRRLNETFVGGARGRADDDVEDSGNGASFWFDMDVGGMLFGIFKRTFGSLSDPSRFMSSKLGAKRKMSGAELSAWIGLATQSSLGLDDPKRKVRARAVM